MGKIKRNFNELNDNIIKVGILLIASVIIGTYLNKIWPQYQQIGIESLNNLKQIYKSDIPLGHILMSNIKSDLLLMLGISICTLFFVTIPVAVLMYIYKGISIGYIINSAIIMLKYEGIAIVLLSVIKNSAIILGMIALAVMSIEYIKNISKQYKSKHKEEVLFLGKRYIINTLIISCITVSVQAILNGVFIWMVKFFVK